MPNPDPSIESSPTPPGEPEAPPTVETPPANAPEGTESSPTDPASPAEGEPTGEAAPVAGSASPHPGRKRKRRRRRKGPRPASGIPSDVQGAPCATPEENPGETAEGETSGETSGETRGEAKGTEDKNKSSTKNREGRKKRKGKDHPPREAREPRERPAFNVGDVVFGKILEITDEAILVDLAGKGKAIFDRREMLLPDEPNDGSPPPPDEQASAEPAVTEPPPPPPPTDPSPALEPTALAEAAPDATPPEIAPPEPVSPAGSPSEKALEIASAVPDGFTDAPTEPGTRPVPVLIPTGDPHRRIVKPRHVLEAENKPPAPLAEEPSQGTPAPEPAARAEGSESGPRPTPQMYAPPIVLELGAHFVALVHNDGARGGLVVLTRHPHRASKAKLVVNAALKDNKPIEGLVTGVVKGGVEVDVDGLRAFAPGSHMDLRLGADLHHFIGKRLDFVVTQYGKRGRDVVLSRKPMLGAEARAQREAALEKLKPGSVVEGTVRSVVAFGAFIDVGGVEGLVPLPEMSHNRADTPSDVFKVGETVSVKILRVDEKRKVWLSRKAAIADPWGEVAKKYAVGTRHTGKVVRLQPFGAFVELEPGIDGLIHAIDLSIKRIEHPNEVVKVDQPIEVVVASIDGGTRKIALHPALTGATADEPHQKVVVHKPVKCAVVAVEAGGLVVRILGATGRHARGFITAAATGTPRGTELRKPFPVGSQLEAKVMELDPRRGEAKLSIKALREETERSAYQQYRQQVNREAKFGTFADLLAKKNVPPQK